MVWVISLMSFTNCYAKVIMKTHIFAKKLMKNVENKRNLIGI